jgi:molybdopterin converting factor small subunit
MARVVSISSRVRELTGGLDTFNVDAGTVGGLIRALEARFPGLGALVENEMSLAIDGEVFQDALAEPLQPGTEVVLIPRISGG